MLLMRQGGSMFPCEACAQMPRVNLEVVSLLVKRLRQIEGYGGNVYINTSRDS
jgi:hypothetical protein